MRRLRNWILAAAAAFAAAVAAGDAIAQDYTVTNVSGRYETVPGTAVDLLYRPDSLINSGVWVDLPFSFRYYGSFYDRMWVSAKGLVQFGAIVGSTTLDNAVFPQAPTENGIVAPCWDFVSGRAWGWTAGTAPNRRYIVAWDNVALSYASNPNKVSFAVILYEGSGRIVFAYTPGTGTNPWSSGVSYTAGIDSPGDSRFVAVPSNTFHSGVPASDYQLDPTIVVVTGNAQYDRIVADASGLANSVEPGRAASGLRVELRTATTTAAAAYCDAAGGFTLIAAALPAGATGSVHLVADAAGCRVVPVQGGYATSMQIGGPYALTPNVATGTLVAGTAGDGLGTTRAAIDIAAMIGRASSWAATRTTTSIPALEVVYEPGSALPTFYTRPLHPAAALLRIGSAASGNDDGWDRSVVLKQYAYHLLGSIAGLPYYPADTRFDVATTPENAFAEAFGYHLGAVHLGTSVYVDATDASHAIVIDLENVQPSSPRAADVTAWVTSALFDTVDAANETHDRIDGTLGDSDRVLRAVDSLSVAPTANSLLTAWVAAGFDAAGIRRLYIDHGFLADDANEPDDDAAEATPSPLPGWLRTGLTLQPDNEDWFAVTLPSNVGSLLADVSFARSTNAAQVLVEIRNAAGAVVATAATQPGFLPVHCVAGALPAGTYRVRVAHTGGPAISPYSLQVFSLLTLGPAQFPDGTIGRPYVVQFDVGGGVAPILLTTTAGNPLPSGVVIDSAHQRLSGTPDTPGQYSLSILAQDAGTPSNLLSVARTFVLNPPLALALGEFVAFPLGRAPAPGALSSGGTAPRSFTVTTGALPDGVTLASDRLAFEGTATTEQSVRFHVDGIDVAGSADSRDVIGVVCPGSSAGRAEMTLGAGDAACGFSFDAVAGSTVSVAIAAGKKQARRALTGAVLRPDGTASLEGFKPKAASGKWSASGVVCPVTGRYFVVVASAAGEAAQMLGSVKIAPPKGGKLLGAPLATGDRVFVEVGAVAGARITLKASPAKKTDLVLGVQTLIDPSGVYVAPGANATAVGSGVALAMTLPASGTWTIVLSARSGSGAYSASYKLAQPKGVAFVVE